MVIKFNTVKCALNTLLRTSSRSEGAVAAKEVLYNKVAPKITKKVQPKLFTVKKDPVIGTQITNNLTGTRYLQRPALNSSNVQIEGLTTFHRADGSYGSISNSKFNQLLANMKDASWNPVIKSDRTIGQELRINNSNFVLGEGRYFRPAEGPASNMLTRITPQHYNSVNMADFDNAILKLLG